MKLSVISPLHGRAGPVRLSRVADLPVLEYETWDPSRSTAMIKRGFDIVVSSVGLLLTAPLFPLIAIAIRLDSRGPVFFNQTRAGLDGRPFQMHKFRTMVADAEEPPRRRRPPRRPPRPGVQALRRPAGDPGRAASCAASASTSCRSSGTSCAAR